MDEFDGKVTRAIEDPVAGVRVRSLFIDWVTHQATVTLTYYRQSGAPEREEILHIGREEFAAFTDGAIARSKRKATRALSTLVAMERLSDVIPTED